MMCKHYFKAIFSASPKNSVRVPATQQSEKCYSLQAWSSPPPHTQKDITSGNNVPSRVLTFVNDYFNLEAHLIEHVLGLIKRTVRHNGHLLPSSYIGGSEEDKNYDNGQFKNCNKYKGSTDLTSVHRLKQARTAKRMPARSRNRLI